MVVNPWGEVVMQLSVCEMEPQPYDEAQDLPQKAPDIGYFDIDLGEVEKVRAAMPLQQQRRPDVYGA